MLYTACQCIHRLIDVFLEAMLSWSDPDTFHDTLMNTLDIARFALVDRFTASVVLDAIQTVLVLQPDVLSRCDIELDMLAIAYSYGIDTDRTLFDLTKLEV
jgi:hypothetical protein